MSADTRLMLSVFPSFVVGGAQVRFVRLAESLGDAWRHAIIAMDGATACAERLPPGLDVTYPVVAVRKGDTVGNVRRFRALLRTLRPDLLVTHNWGSIEWAMANITGLVRHVHIEDGFGPEERARQIGRRVWTRRLVLRRATVVLPSRTLERIAAEVWRLPRGRIRYVPNGIDLARYAARQGKRGDPPVIGTVAALRPEKNLARLIGAFARVLERRPARLAIVGDGPERAALEALARNRGVAGAVTFHGQQADPAPFYQGFDLFALSSDTEQMPLSVLEAMGTGLAVAATDVGDVRAMLAPENAPLVVERDESSLAAAILAALANPEACDAMGRANRRRAEQEFDAATMIERYGAIFAGTG